MTSYDPLQVKALLASILQPALAAHGLSSTDLRDDFDLRREGLIDSLGFMTLLSELETRLGCQIDLAEMEPDQLTRVGSLTLHIARRRFPL
jgi:acyl carrier protein